MTYANFVRISIMQQFSNKGYSDYSDAGTFPSLASALFVIIKGMSIIPEQLFGLISQSPHPEKLREEVDNLGIESDYYDSYNQYMRPWIGFLFLIYQMDTE